MTTKLEQAAQNLLDYFDIDDCGILFNSRMEALREALSEQAEQEPVAWYSVKGGFNECAKELTGANISLYNLAKEAGFDVAQWAINGGIEVVIYEEGPITEELTRFAALVAAHEREACAKLVEAGVFGHGECAAAIRARNSHEKTN